MTEESVYDRPSLKTYRARWWILAVYIVYNIVNGLQWLEYSIVTNLVMKYYGVSVSSVDWTCLVFSVAWPLFVFPAAYFVDSGGLRVALLWGSILAAVGAIVKVLSIDPSRFYVVLIGQAFAGISQVFTFTLPPKVASTWFPPEEASTVCSLGVFAITLGTGLGFIVPPLVVHDHDDLDAIGSDLNVMCWGLAVPTTLIALTVIFYFPNEPRHAPCLAAHYLRENKTSNVPVYLKQILKILKNKPFMMHAASYTCVFGGFCAFQTILNQLVLQFFEGGQEYAGQLGLLMTVISIPSTVLLGILLDKTHKYKECAIVTTLACAISLGGFLYGLTTRTKWLCNVFSSFLGILFGAYMTLGFELAIELTYPMPESVVSSILMFTSQIVCLFFTMFMSDLNVRFGALYSLSAQIAIFALGTLTTILTSNKLYRQKAFKDENFFRDVKFQKVDRGQ